MLKWHRTYQPSVWASKHSELDDCTTLGVISLKARVPVGSSVPLLPGVVVDEAWDPAIDAEGQGPPICPMIRELATDSLKV
jgi:hypothetical protein